MLWCKYYKKECDVFDNIENSKSNTCRYCYENNGKYLVSYVKYDDFIKVWNEKESLKNLNNELEFYVRNLITLLKVFNILELLDYEKKAQLKNIIEMCEDIIKRINIELSRE